MERAGLEPATPSLQSQVGVIPGKAAPTRNDRDYQGIPTTTNRL